VFIHATEPTPHVNSMIRNHLALGMALKARNDIVSASLTSKCSSELRDDGRAIGLSDCGSRA
jgi:hypothetical protein